MKTKIEMVALMANLSRAVPMPHLFNVQIPAEIWEKAANGTGYYNGYKVLIEEVKIQHHLSDENYYVVEAHDIFDRKVWIFRAAAGAGVAFERYRHGEADIIVSNCDGIATHIFGGRAFDYLSRHYLNALGEYQNTDTDIPVGLNVRFSAQQVITALRTGKDDGVLWASNQALRRLMSLCISVRNAQWVPAGAVVNDYYAAARNDSETESDWDLVVEYLVETHKLWPALRNVLALLHPIESDAFNYLDVAYNQHICV